MYVNLMGQSWRTLFKSIMHAGYSWTEANIRNSVSVGESVHICVESQDGSRFDPNMTDEECFKLCKSKFHFRTSV